MTAVVRVFRTSLVADTGLEPGRSGHYLRPSQERRTSAMPPCLVALQLIRTVLAPRFLAAASPANGVTPLAGMPTTTSPRRTRAHRATGRRSSSSAPAGTEDGAAAAGHDRLRAEAVCRTSAGIRRPQHAQAAAGAGAHEEAAAALGAATIISRPPRSRPARVRPRAPRGGPRDSSARRSREGAGGRRAAPRVRALGGGRA